MTIMNVVVPLRPALKGRVGRFNEVAPRLLRDFESAREVVMVVPEMNVTIEARG